MSLLTKQDLEASIRAERLDQIVDANDLFVDEAILDAESIVMDALFDKYDTETIFEQTEVNRHRTVLRWLKYLTLYYIYERVPDQMVPERVIKNYEDTKIELHKVNDGKLSVNLPRRTEEKPNGERPKTNTRWSSVPKRSL